MGTYYAFSKRNVKQFSWERFLRLGIPLFVGMLLIVPPQIYIERLVNGEFSGSYLDFYQTALFRGGPYPEGNISWHHLWFLPYLLLFSLVLGPLFYRLKRRPSKLVAWTKKTITKNPTAFMSSLYPYFFAEGFIEPFYPTTHALVGDWYTIVFYMLLFFYGFLLLATQETFWKSLVKIRKRALVIGVISFTLLVCRWLFIERDEIFEHLMEALLKVVNLWSWILVLFGYAAKYLNKASNGLTYANRAVYPFYILHQTITIIIAYFLMGLNWGFVIKFSILLMGTFGFSWLIYDLIILRIRWLHPLFGLKKVNSSN